MTTDETRRATRPGRTHGNPCPIVAVGASAGGLDAFRRLLRAIPADIHASLVFVQHLDPSRPTKLAELLAADSPIPVELATDGTLLEPGHAYVVPEGRVAGIDGRTLHLRERDDEPRPVAIDTFFIALAENSGPGACAVLMSGLGSDGTHGLREIAAAGGLTFVQDPATAEYDSMPRSAIDARVADFVGSPEEIAASLHARAPLSAKSGEEQADSEVVGGILALIAREAGLDFTQYKQTTVRRRIGRRAVLRDIEDLREYADVLRREPEELRALVDDMLINVTEFFRDPEVFAALRDRVIPSLLAERGEGDSLRIWVPACSTGEEVYSILITILEALDGVASRPDVTVFGTDASERAIRAARRGVYAETITETVSPERLARFFERVQDGYQVNRQLREMCVFARQDITSDTPFSRIDLVSLRNLLIYFQPPLQRRVLAIVHYALVPDGFLVLGTSESPDGASKLFSAYDKHAHVYRRRPVPAHLPIDISGSPRNPLDPYAFANRTPDQIGGSQVQADELALAAFAPPRVLVDEEGHIEHFYGDSSAYLEHGEGRASLSLLDMAAPAISCELREAFDTAKSTGASAIRDVVYAAEGQQRHVSLHVLPLPDSANSPHYLVAFVEIALPTESTGGAAGEDLARLYENREERLRREMASMRSRIRSVAEEKDYVNQALRAANEEVSSSNEELQSINEELETAKEELQSSNEELITVNEELRERNRDLAVLNDVVTNFVDSAEIPLVMVDTELRIRRHTPQADRIFHIQPSDENRYLPHLRFRIELPDVEMVIRDVMGSGRPYEREVRDESGCWYLMRVRPYRSAEERIEGAVLSFIDIDELKHSMRRLERQGRLTAALNEIDAAISSTLDFDVIMQRALDEGVRVLEADAGTIEVLEGDGWRVRYQHGFRDGVLGMALPAGDAPLAVETARTLQPQIVPDVPADSGVNVGFLAREKVRSALAVPLVVNDHGIGCLLFFSLDAARSFSRSEIEFARRLASSASLALENARLLERTRRSTRLAETLNRVNDILRAALTPDDLLERLVNEVSETAGADRCLVVEVQGTHLRVTHVRNVSPEIVGEARSAEYFRSFSLLAQQRRPLLIDDAWDDPRTNPDFVVPFELRAMQMMPLVVDDELVGELIFSYDEPRTFDQGDYEFSEKLSQALSLALRNARLFEAERRRADFANAMAATETAIHSSLDSQRMMELAVAEGARALGADSGAMSLYRDHEFVVTVASGFAEDIRGSVMSEEQERHSMLALETREPVLIEDVATDPRVDSEHVLSYGVAAVIVVPLIVQGNAVGDVFYNFSTPRRFAPDEVEFARRIGSSLSLAFDNARLYDELRESEKKYRNLFTHLIDGFAVHRVVRDDAGTPVDYVFVEVNEAFERLTGLKSEDIVGKRATEVLPDIENDPADWIGVYGQVATTGETVRFEQRSQDLGRWYQISAYSPEPDYFVTVFDDISERKQAEVELAESRLRADQLAAMLQNSSTPFAAAGADGLLMDFNAAYEELTGYSGDELRSMNWRVDLTPEEWRPVDAEMIELQHERGGAIRYEKEYVRKDGTHVPVELYRNEHRTENGETDYYYAFFTDLTERKAVETRLMRQNSIVNAINRIFSEALNAHSDEELGRICLSVAEEMTGSEIGFVGEIGEDGLLHDIAMSETGWSECAMEDQSGHKRMPGTFSLHGLYGKILSDGAGLCTNEPSAHPASIGVPEGHPTLTSFLGAPLKNGDRTIGIIAVGNRPEGYTDEHVQALEALAPAVVEALHRVRIEQSLDRERREADSQREAYLARLVKLLDVSTDVLAAETLEDMLHRLSDAAREIIGANYAVAGHSYRSGSFDVGQSTASGKSASFAEGEEIPVGLGGPYLDLVEEVESLRLTEEELERHPKWKGLPKAHIKLRGLLGARLRGADGQAVGIVMLSDKDDGDFTHEDELLLRQLASIASLGLQHIESRQEVADERERLRTIIDEIPVGITLLDAGGAVVEINEANEAIWGGKFPQIVGPADYLKLPMFHLSSGERFDIDDFPAMRALRTGHTARSVARIDRFIGGTATVRIVAVPIKNALGEMTGVIALTEDVTEQFEYERLREALNDIGSTVSATLDYDEILNRLTIEAADALGAQSATIMLRDSNGWKIHDMWGVVEDISGRTLSDDEVPLAVLAAEAKRPVAIDDAIADPRVNKELASSVGARAMLMVPLIVHGQVAGIATFNHTAPVVFSDARFDFADKLVSVISLALENAKLYERERRIADTLQEAILAPPEEIPGVEVSYLYRPASTTANVGGDFYDLFRIDDTHFAVVVGDVSGKGIDAARLTSLLRDGIRAYAYEHVGPATVLQHVNDLVRRSSPLESFATAFFGILDTESGELRFCAAGHPPALVLSSDGATPLSSPTSAIVGAFLQATFNEGTATLRRGDTLLLYTDGINEARRDGKQFGEQRLADAAARLVDTPLADMPDRLLAEVLDFTGGMLQDDTVVMAVRWQGDEVAASA